MTGAAAALLIVWLDHVVRAADRAAGRSRDEDLGRRIGQVMRRIEATLEGISDHQELLAGLRALVRMVRSDPA